MLKVVVSWSGGKASMLSKQLFMKKRQLSRTYDLLPISRSDPNERI